MFWAASLERHRAIKDPDEGIWKRVVGVVCRTLITQNHLNVLACVSFGAVHCGQNVRFPGHQGRPETFIQGVMVQTKGSGEV